jgi:hypothetical protein
MPNENERFPQDLRTMGPAKREAYRSRWSNWTNDEIKAEYIKTIERIEKVQTETAKSVDQNGKKISKKKKEKEDADRWESSMNNVVHSEILVEEMIERELIDADAIA